MRKRTRLISSAPCLQQHVGHRCSKQHHHHPIEAKTRMWDEKTKRLLVINRRVYAAWYTLLFWQPVLQCFEEALHWTPAASYLRRADIPDYYKTLKTLYHCLTLPVAKRKVWFS